jgi:hemin uptake protein HemP
MTHRAKAPHEKQSAAGAPQSDDDSPVEIDAQSLFGARQEVTIIHAGERYRLRITANNKLILTK